MTIVSVKPVKECHGCRLNLLKNCAVFEYPIQQWKRHRCDGYNNPEMIAQYEKSLQPEGAKKRHMERAEKAKIQHTITHLDGVHKLGGRC